VNCAVCGNQLYASRTVFLCSCSAITHAQCWEKHIVESHKPSFTTGVVTMDGRFIPKSAETEEGSPPSEKELVAIERK